MARNASAAQQLCQRRPRLASRMLGLAELILKAQEGLLLERYRRLIIGLLCG